MRRLLPVLFALSAISALGQTRSMFTPLGAADYPITAEGLPYFALSEPVGRASEGCTYKVSIEYPEYAALTPEERSLISESGIEVPDSMTVDVFRGVARGDVRLDISFCPIVNRGGRPMRLVSCRVRIDTLQPRQGIAEAQDFSAAARYRDHSVLASGRWVKIAVASEGIYSLTPAALAQMGFSNPARVRLFGYGGRMLPELLEFSGRNAVTDDLEEIPLYRRSDALLFFAEGTRRWTDGVHANNPYSTLSYYFLTEGDAPAAFETLPAPTETASQVLDEAYHYAAIDNDEFAWYGGGREMFDSHDFSGTNTKTFGISLPGITGTSLTSVTWEFTAAGSTQSCTAQMSVGPSFSEVLSSNVIDKCTSSDAARGRRRTFTMRATTSDLQFRIASTAGIPAHLNFIRIKYPKQLTANAGNASFSPDVVGAVSLKIANANGNTKLWRIGRAGVPAAQVASRLSGTTLTAYAADGMERYVIVNTAGNYPEPTYIGAVGNQDLHADSNIDYVIFVPSSGALTAEAERLANVHRTRSGLKVKVVNVGQVYNEFSSGTPDATALRRYLKMLYDRAGAGEGAPRFALFFGDCAWDNRILSEEWKATGLTPADLLPAYEANDYEGKDVTGNSFSYGSLRSYVTDDYFGLLDDGEGATVVREKIDLGLGRFPCHDAEKARFLVDKCIDYLENKSAGIWKNKIYLIGDYGDNNMHMNDAEAVAKQIDASGDPDMLMRRIYPDAYTVTMTATGSYYPLASQKLKTEMNKGALIFNYNGHGSPEKISHANLMLLSDVKATQTASLPLWIYASCEITPIDQLTDDLGRAALFNQTGGAVAVMCASRSVFANYNRTLNVAYVNYLLGKTGGRRSTMGEALQLAKAELVSRKSDNTINKLKYTLLGDPALYLAIPQGQVVVDKINGAVVNSGTRHQLAACSVAEIEGYVTDGNGAADSGFEGTLSAILLCPKENIICKGNGSVMPLTYQDYNKTMFEGSVSVKDGRFTLRIPIPRDINYSDDDALLSLYAVNKDHSLDCNGHFTDIYMNGTDPNADADTQGPSVMLYLNTPDFPNGGIVGATPLLHADVSDNVGLSINGATIGHNIELVIDDEKNAPINLNDFFTFDFGSYNRGHIAYQLPAMARGKHKVQLRVWDVNSNLTNSELAFTVHEEGAPDRDVFATQNPTATGTTFIASFFMDTTAGIGVTMEVYDIAGRRVWHKDQSVQGANYVSVPWQLTDTAGTPLPSGIYIYRAIIDGKETKAKKLVIL
ncbi:MAG: type IX secretion system sortase PorU [Bacteroidales bacterium]|nr:type IX secretion system sortase PorU [Bacteroidales bacterium]